MDNILRHEDCWAKTTADGHPGINVRDHCLNVGCVAEALLELLPTELQRLFPSGASTLAALHDIGKVSPGFQSKCAMWLTKSGLLDRALKEGWRVSEQDHAKVSQFTVREILKNSRLSHWAAIVGAHHGKLKGRLSPEAWGDERGRLARELIAQFGPLPDHPAEDAVLWFTAGLIAIADWIGSDEEHFPNEPWTIDERRSRARQALQANGWKHTPIANSLSFAQIFPTVEAVNSLQQETMGVIKAPGIYVVEGPMGCGKTEAALIAAYQLLASGQTHGLYFALPTQITSNRIHERVQSFVDRICTDTLPVRLAHSASWLVDSTPPLRLRAVSADRDASDHVQAGRSWFMSPKRALLVPFGVGTIDQSLLAILAANHFFVRLFGLAGKVVILDEVHTYDLYTSTLIDSLVKRMRQLQCTVIILSATLTEKRRRELLQLNDNQPVSPAYPLISGVAGSLIERQCEQAPPKAVHIRNLAGSVPVEEVLLRAHRGECVLWIRNTVDQAQETYRTLQGTSCEGGPTIALLHSRFPYFRREELETEWMDRLGKNSANRPTGCILVSTQVAEQSVDIDADLLITDLAPTDMLLQRIGRLWRHERASRACPRPEVWIQMPFLDDDELLAATEIELRSALGKSARIYAPYVLLRSLQQWRGRAEITLPGDIRPILEATYADPPASEPSAWQKLREEIEAERKRLQHLADRATRIWVEPALEDEEGVQTRYSTYPMAQLVLVRRIERHDGRSVRIAFLNGDAVIAVDHKWSFVAAKAIYRNITRVPRWAVCRFVLDTPDWLSYHVHQVTAVGFLQPDGSIRAMDGETDMGLSYHSDEGIRIHRDRLKQPPKEDDEYLD